MLSNHLLEMKDRTQKQLIKKAEYDIKTYMENLHTISRKIEKEHGMIFQYANINNEQPTTVYR